MLPLVGKTDSIETKYLKVLEPLTATMESPTVGRLTSTANVPARPPGRPALI